MDGSSQDPVAPPSSQRSPLLCAPDHGLSHRVYWNSLVQSFPYPRPFSLSPFDPTDTTFPPEGALMVGSGCKISFLIRRFVRSLLSSLPEQAILVFPCFPILMSVPFFFGGLYNGGGEFAFFCPRHILPGPSGVFPVEYACGPFYLLFRPSFSCPGAGEVFFFPSMHSLSWPRRKFMR